MVIPRKANMEPRKIMPLKTAISTDRHQHVCHYIPRSYLARNGRPETTKKRIYSQLHYDLNRPQQNPASDSQDDVKCNAPVVEGLTNMTQWTNQLAPDVLSVA